MVLPPSEQHCLGGGVRADCFLVTAAAAAFAAEMFVLVISYVLRVSKKSKLLLS